MDSSTYRCLFGQISDSSVTYHYNIPSHNLLSPETLAEVSKDLNDDTADREDKFLGSFPCYQRFPYGVRTSFPLFYGSGAIDYARDLVDKKLQWELRLKKLRISNINNAVHCIKKLRKNEDVTLSDDLKRYMNHFHNDPQPVFSGDYNWLYTGGCLNYDETGTTLISADYIGNRPGFYLLQLNKTIDEVEYKSFTSLKVYSPVLQIESKSQQEGVVICVRQKNRLSLFRAKRESEFSEKVKLWAKKTSGMKLLTCVDLKDNCQEVVLTDTSRDIHVFDVERRKKIHCYSGRRIASRKNPWSQVAFGDQTLYWATWKCFVVFDYRDLNSGPKLELNPTTLGEKCEKICSFVTSKCNSNFVYLATNHNTLQMDLRNGKAVQKWTHMMENSPQFVTTIKDKENELLVLQSQKTDETVGIINECLTDGEKVNFVSRSLPCLLRGMKDSLNLAHLQGECLNPCMGKRINFAVTGMRCLKNCNGEIILVTKNSGGDVFLSKIKKTAEGGDGQPEVLERMKNYQSHVENIPLKDTTSRHREIVDMSRLLDKFSQRSVKRKRKEAERVWKYEETYSPESVKYYKDVIARKILQVWGHGRGSSEEEEDEEEDAMSVDHKVREWMERC